MFHHSELVIFPPIFAPAYYKVTESYNYNCAIHLFNCKFDFTTAEIVIGYTLKYALVKPWFDD